MGTGAQQAEKHHAESWRDPDAHAAAYAAQDSSTPTAPIALAEDDTRAIDPPPPPVFWRETVPAAILALTGFGWITAVGWIVATASPITPDALGLIGWIGLASGPLALIAILYLLLQRTSRREARRFARSARAMGEQAAYLERVIAGLSLRIDEQRALLTHHAEVLLEQGDKAVARLGEISGAIRQDTAQLSQSSALLADAAAVASSDMGVLMTDLPLAEAQTRQMAELLLAAGRSAREQAAEFANQLAAMAEHGREAEAVAESAGGSLAAHLARIEESGAAADRRMRDAGASMARTVEEALSQAAQAIDDSRKAIDAQGAAMLAMIEQSRAALDRAGSDSARSLGQRLDDLGAKVDSLASRLAAQDAASHALVGNLDKALAGIEQRFAALGETGTERTADLAEAIVALSEHVDKMAAVLTGGGDAADALLQRASLLRASLDASAREIGETLPAALAAAAPEAERLETAARAANTLLGEGNERVATMRDQAETLHALIVDADENSRKLADGAGPKLVEALLRVREAAAQAADHARETLASVIPEAAGRIASASGEAVDRALAGRVEKQMAEVVAAAEQAVRTAADASERLTREMLAISETTATVERRIEKAKADAEKDANFSHQVALLIESLNSTSIDVTKILSNEVTDSAWAAYLKGDRGIFTRRAVRLISAGEAREIARHYQEEPEFREQVNRYIHDFEAMLRRILASRDSSPLSVTILSSDMGKLYVALAQAIERLRR